MGDRVGVELLFNSVEFESKKQLAELAVAGAVGSWVRQRQFEFQLSWRWNVVGKATSGRRGLLALMSWCPEKMLIRYSKKASIQQSGPHGPGWTSRERERNNVTAIRSGGQNIAVMVDLQLPLTCNPWTTLSNPCNKVRGKYIFKEVFLHLPSCVVYFCVRLFIYCVVVML